MINLDSKLKEKFPKIHIVEWSDKKIDDYWSVFGNITPSSPWFSEKSKHWILKEIKKNYLNLNKNTKLLDMGCGSGKFLNFIKNELKIDCYGIDVAKERIINCKEKYKNINFSIGSTEKTSYENNFFDIIISTQTIEHLDNKKLHNSFLEFNRILKPNGILLITTRYNEDLSKGVKLCPDCHAVFKHSQHMQSFSIERLKDILENYTFTSVILKRSICKLSVEQYFISRFTKLNKLIYFLFGSYFDKKKGKYLYSLSKKN